MTHHPQNVRTKTNNSKPTMSSLRCLRLHLHLSSKTTIFKLHFPATPQLRSPFSSLPSNEPPPLHPQTTLSEEHLTKINHLIPRLLDSEHLPTALRLTTTALLANPPLHSLPLSPLIHSLSSQPDMTHSMSLLTHLYHTPPSHHYIKPITLMLLTSCFQLRKCKHALSVYRWMKRPDSPCSPDERVYGVVIEGFCRNGFVLEGLKALRDMVGGAKLVPFCDSREWVYRGLLREARVKEAVELNDALLSWARDGGDGDADGEGRERVLEVLERVIAQWTE